MIRGIDIFALASACDPPTLPINFPFLITTMSCQLNKGNVTATPLAIETTLYFIFFLLCLFFRIPFHIIPTFTFIYIYFIDFI